MTTFEGSGALVLCDVAQIDRGKVNILGAGWNRCSPDRRVISALFVLQLPVPDDEQTQDLSTTFQIWRSESFGEEGQEPEVGIELTGEVDFGDAKDRDFPFVPVSVPVNVPAQLKPSSSYILAAFMGGQLTAAAGFVTVGADEAVA